MSREFIQVPISESDKEAFRFLCQVKSISMAERVKAAIADDIAEGRRLLDLHRKLMDVKNSAQDQEGDRK